MKGVAVSSDGVLVCYETDGSGAPALVFVHGWSCDRRYWSRQVGHFVGRYQVVVIDLAGHGDSGGGREAWTMPSFGSDVVAVIESLGLEEVVLVGHSMGGDVIAEAAARIPDRVAGLVWADVYRSLGRLRTPDELEEFLVPFREDFVDATRAFVRAMFVQRSDPDLVEWVVADMSAAPPAVALDAMAHVIGNDRAILARLREATAPIVAINPDYQPSDIAALKHWGVRTMLMSGVGHFLMMEDPTTFNRLLDETVAEFKRHS
jgi:pimeloyl-ACP methyl ester carboxylesterase